MKEWLIKSMTNQVTEVGQAIGQKHKWSGETALTELARRHAGLILRQRGITGPLAKDIKTVAANAAIKAAQSLRGGR